MDLLHNDLGQVDFGDFQMVIIPILAVVTYAIQCFISSGDLTKFVSPPLKNIQLPDVDSTILAVFGLAQGAYLTKKYAREHTVASGFHEAHVVLFDQPLNCPVIRRQVKDRHL